VYFFTFLFMSCLLPFCVYFVYDFYTTTTNNKNNERGKLLHCNMPSYMYYKYKIDDKQVFKIVIEAD